MNKYLLFTLLAPLFIFACAKEVEENIEFLEELELDNNIEAFNTSEKNDSNLDSVMVMSQLKISKNNKEAFKQDDLAKKTNSKAEIKQDQIERNTESNKVASNIPSTIHKFKKEGEVITKNNSFTEEIVSNNTRPQSYVSQNKSIVKKDRIFKLDTLYFDDVIEQNNNKYDSLILSINRVEEQLMQLVSQNKEINKKSRAYKADTIFLDEAYVYNTNLKESKKLSNLSQLRDNNKLIASLPNKDNIPKNIFEVSKKEVQNKVNTNDSIERESFKAKENNQAKSNNNSVERTFRSNLNNGGNYKNTSNRKDTEIEENEITALFTDPAAHKKKFKKEKPLNSKLKVEAYKNSTQNTLSSTINKAEAKPVINTKPVRKTNTPLKEVLKPIEVTTTVKNLETPLKNASKVNRPVLNNAFKRNTLNNNEFYVKLMRKQSSYKTNENHTLLIEVTNNGDYIEPINLVADLPQDWKLISISPLVSLNANEKKISLVSFYIPTQSAPGNTKTTFILKTNNYSIQSFDFDLNVEDNYDLEVFNISAPKQLEAGETIEAFYGIRNKGNVSQELSLTSRNTIDGESKILIPKDSTIVVKIIQETNSKSNTFRKLSTNLDVLSNASGKTYYNSKSVDVIPTKIAQKDPFLRFPVQASLYYSSYTNNNDHYSTMSAELKGNGFLDEARNHHLNFTIRAPKKENLRRFSIVDQYSLIYRYKNKATLYLGDHSYFINRLGFGSRYGMGFKLDYNINKWTLSAFYSKPRLYNYRSKALYGLRADYFMSDTQNIGITLEKSQGNVYTYRNLFNEQGKGQILTLDYDYQDDNTFVEAELSTSFNGKKIDYATNFNISQNVKDFRYSSYLLYASENYLGNISNSIQLTNSLYYNRKSFNVGVGHALSRVNRRLDPELFETEPYYENYFASLGYRFTGKHYLNFRFDKRIREDQLMPKSYHYEEYGFNYNFVYTDKLFTGSFGGRFAKSENLLTAETNYRNTYTHHLNVSYLLFKNFTLRGGLNHIYTGRYGLSDESINFVRYNFGFNYRISKWLRANGNFNSGFSPEEDYKRRDYINFNLIAQVNRRHRFEARANYFERPGVVNNKELYAFGKYTYTFGVPVKRILEQGGVRGSVYTNNKDIDIRGIKLYTTGKAIMTDRYGNFELNNLPIGTNYIFIDDSSLPLDVVSKIKNPIEIKVEADRTTDLGIELMRSGSLYGNLKLLNSDRAIDTNLESYVKLENKDFTYYTEANNKGEFKFQNIVPGDYKFTLIRFKKNDKLFKLVKEKDVTVKEEIDTNLEIKVTGKERKIRFKNNNLKVVYNED
ncbi:hypothetical protein OE09_0366 [Flavobacteriaceae bacterium MAR_2010_72]|nr:hypothetical protein OE09_0366 [Flavobacteriaceae bacterium MAR_2010_72]